MRDYDAIIADATHKSPFSNGTSGEIWMDGWCYRCKVDGPFQRGNAEEGCPLLLVAYMQMTPKEWTEVGLQDYHCSEFVPDDDGRDGDPDPNPAPLPGQTDIFSVFADAVAEDASRVRELVPVSVSQRTEAR